VPAEDHPLDAWRKVMGLNADAMFLVSQQVGKRCMIPRRSGKIVNVASVAGLTGNPPQMQTVAYNASKSAAIGFTRALASEWGRYNINVNAICPGFFPTKMAKGLLEQIGEAVVRRTPLGRLGGEEDLKGAVVFLASEASRHVTGQWLAVDGGAWIT
jgi:NAD(P)-dependent dehydrogenase (short-subunit alcohol dehydrogenase family)